MFFLLQDNQLLVTFIQARVAMILSAKPIILASPLHNSQLWHFSSYFVPKYEIYSGLLIASVKCLQELKKMSNCKNERISHRTEEVRARIDKKLNNQYRDI